MRAIRLPLYVFLKRVYNSESIEHLSDKTHVLQKISFQGDSARKAGQPPRNLCKRVGTSQQLFLAFIGYQLPEANLIPASKRDRAENKQPNAVWRGCENHRAEALRVIHVGCFGFFDSLTRDSFQVCKLNRNFSFMQ